MPLQFNVVRKSVPFVLASLALATSGAACSSVSEDGQSWAEAPMDAENLTEVDSPVDVEEQIGSLRQPLTGTHKVCSSVGGSSFRDTIIVPNSWDRADCLAFSRAIGNTSFSLACISNDGFLGFGDPPALNPCGW